MARVCESRPRDGDVNDGERWHDDAEKAIGRGGGPEKAQHLECGHGHGLTPNSG